MDGISSVSRSIDAVNQMMQTAQAKTIETAEKMMKMNVEMTLGSEQGKGQLLDIVA